jgi:hypothetical protein
MKVRRTLVTGLAADQRAGFSRADFRETLAPMPAPVAPLLGFVVGILFAWAAADDLARTALPTSRSLIVVAAFGLLVHAPIAAYFLATAPDWSWAYLLSAERLPMALGFGWVLLTAASVPAGFAAAARPAAAKRLSHLVRIGALPAILAAAFLAAAFRRLEVDGSYAQYHGDFGTRPVAGSSLGWALLWMCAVLTGGIAWTLRCLRMLSRRAARD